MKYATKFCWLFFFVFAFANQSFAVEISEIHPTEEYIEIFSDKDTSLQGWRYSEMTSMGKENFYTIAHSSIAKDTYLLITLSSKINDTGDTIRLYDAENIVQDEIIVPAKKETFSYSKVLDTWIWQRPTPTTHNIIATIEPTPSPSIEPTTPPSSLFISEILANPEGSDAQGEFFEIYNDSEHDISLSQWYVMDASGKKYIFEDILLTPYEYHAFYAVETKITLNNTAETLFLYDATHTLHHTLSFDESIEEGKSFVWTKEKTGIGSPSPNTKNSIIPSLGSTQSEENTMIPIPILEKKTNPVDLQITKISPNASLDSIEVQCVACDTDLGNIRLLIDGLSYTIPEGIVARTGDTLRFVFQKDSSLPPEALGDGWIFYVPMSGLSLSDESIMLVDSDSLIIDGICYANYNNALETKEKKDIAIMILQNKWQGGAKEHDCINISVFPKNATLIKTSSKDTNSKNDFQIVLPFQNSELHDTPSSLVFSHLFISTNFIEGKIINTNEEAVSLDGFGLYESGDAIAFLGDGWISYGQEIVFRIALDKQKKISLDSLLLEIRSPDATLVDSICFNWDEKNLSSKQKNKMQEAIQLGKWKLDFHTPHCFLHSSVNPIHLVRNNLYATGTLAYTIQSDGLVSFFSSPSPLPKKTKKTLSSSTPKPDATVSNTSAVSKNPKQKIISHNDIQWLHIEKILPNPDGIDAGMEALYLTNQSPKAGWARGWKIRIVSTAGKQKDYSLPFFFLLPGQTIRISKPFLPSLPNTASLSLLNPYLEPIQTISWNKAKSGQWFGPSAPAWTKTPKKTKSKSKIKLLKKTKKTSSQTLPVLLDESVIGTIQAVHDEAMWILLDTNIVVIAPIPTYLPFSSEVFSIGKPVKVQFSKGNIIDTQPILNIQDTFLPMTPQKHSLFSIWSIALGCIFGGSALWYASRKKNRYIESI